MATVSRELSLFLPLADEWLARGDAFCFTEESGRPCVIVMTGPRGRRCRVTGRCFEEVLPKAISILGSRREGASMPGPARWEVGSCDLDSYVCPEARGRSGRSVYLYIDGEKYKASDTPPAWESRTRPAKHSSNTAYGALVEFLGGAGLDEIEAARARRAEANAKRRRTAPV
jgi:hypothetical protein